MLKIDECNIKSDSKSAVANNDAIKRYAESVAELAREKRNNLMHNEGNEHALIIFSNIFLTAHDYIKIVARDLTNKEVANSPIYIYALTCFLKRKKSKLFILLSHYDDTQAHNSPLFQMIASSDAYKEGRVVIKDMRGRLFRDSTQQEIHFCIADNRIFRLETDIKARKAICNFNDESGMVGKLNDNFSIAYEAETTQRITL